MMQTAHLKSNLIIMTVKNQTRSYHDKDRDKLITLKQVDIIFEVGHQRIEITMHFHHFRVRVYKLVPYFQQKKIFASENLFKCMNDLQGVNLAGSEAVCGTT